MKKFISNNKTYETNKHISEMKKFILNKNTHENNKHITMNQQNNAS